MPMKYFIRFQKVYLCHPVSNELVNDPVMKVALHFIQLKFNPITTEGVQDVMDFLAECHTSGIIKLDFGVSVNQN